jgi:hypothetical protein
VCMIIAGILNVFIWIGLFIMGYYLLQQARLHDSNRLYFILLLFSIVWLSGIYTLFMQFRVFGFLTRSSKNKIDSLIDSIGSE